jgi:uncharacterized membrane protein YdjX (TVP38/TMEM64 family)
VLLSLLLFGIIVGIIVAFVGIVAVAVVGVALARRLGRS